MGFPRSSDTAHTTLCAEIQADHSAAILCRREKNWAMADVNGTLLILHQLAPCLTFLRFEPSAPKVRALCNVQADWD